MNISTLPLPLVAASLALPVAMLLLAGNGLLRLARLDTELVDSGLLARGLLGSLVVAFTWPVAAASGHPLAVWCAALGTAAVPGLRRECLRDLAGCARREAPRWLAYVLIGALVTAAFQGRHVTLTPEAVSWGGTVGLEGLFHASLTQSAAQSFPVHLPWDVDAPPLHYHLFSHALHAWLGAASLADPITLFTRLAPPLLLAASMEASRHLLSGWFGNGKVATVAALAPLVAMDLDVWLRLFGVTPVAGLDNRTALSLVLSPSFVCGQTVACFVIGTLKRATRFAGVDGSSRRALALVAAVAFGSLAGWKLPALVVTAIALAPAARELGAALGARVAFVCVIVAAVTTALAGGICFIPDGRLLATRAVLETDLRFASLLGAPEAWRSLVTWPLLVLLVPAQLLGPRLLHIRAHLRAARGDGLLAGAIATAFLGAGVAVCLSIGPGHEEKYLVRCGGWFLLLFAAARTCRGLSASPRSRAAWAALLVFAVYGAGIGFYATRPGAAAGALSGTEARQIVALAHDRRIVVAGRLVATHAYALPALLDRSVEWSGETVPVFDYDASPRRLAGTLRESRRASAIVLLMTPAELDRFVRTSDSWETAFRGLNLAAALRVADVR